LQGDVWIFMESMLESLDMTSSNVKAKGQRFPEDVLGIVAAAVLLGSVTAAPSPCCTILYIVELCGSVNSVSPW
jgi:hypothetical protein